MTRHLQKSVDEISDQQRTTATLDLLIDLTDLWPAIEHTPGVVGGDACVVRTRIPVWALVQYRRLGWTDAQILESFPTLRQADLAQAWAYAAAYPAEIERALREQETA